jgi:hypothetical protein
MKINTIKTIKDIKENNYIEKINEKITKKCIIQDKKIRNNYYLYYKENTKKIPIRIDCQILLTLILNNPDIMNRTYLFILINKKDNNELRLIFDNEGRLILPKNIEIEDNIKQECIYQLSKIQHKRVSNKNIEIKDYMSILEEVKLNNEKTIFSIK